MPGITEPTQRSDFGRPRHRLPPGIGRSIAKVPCSLAPNPLLESLAALPIRVPFHSIIGNRGIDDGPESSDGIVSYRSAHLKGAESEKMVPAGDNLLSNAAAISEIKRILDKNILGSKP